MRLDLGAARDLTPPALPGRVVRLVTPEDEWPLGTLAFAAYRGTVDDAGETLEQQHEEICATISGRHGPLDVTASFVAADPGALAGATLVTTWQDRPLLAFALVSPAWQGQGTGSALILHSARALARRGAPELTLAVTRSNPARRLYARLGFVEMPLP